MTTRDEDQNRSEFVTLASQRARQLLRGCAPRVEANQKPAGTATREIAEGLVRKLSPDQRT